MNITLNGKDKSLNKVISVSELLKGLDLTPETVVVELNNTILHPESYTAAKLAEGDQVEIIRFVGGG